MRNEKVLILSVGGTAEQIKFSLEKESFDYIIFYVSEQTKRSVFLHKDIYMKYVMEYRFIVTEDAQNLTENFNILYREIDEILSTWDVGWENVTVDYTGGTKAMVAALMLATVNGCNRYRYIAGNQRNKNGVGVVETGKEYVISLENPWNKLAIARTPEINILFNSARYQSARDALVVLKEKIGDSELRNFIDLMIGITEFYIKWDNFDHGKIAKFTRYYHNLKPYGIGRDKLNKFCEKFKSDYDYVNSFNDFKGKGFDVEAKKYMFLSKDLVANAIRRREKENKCEDAVARLYSAFEKFIKAKLYSFNIDNSSIKKDQIPKELIDEFQTDYHKETDEYKCGLLKSAILLTSYDKDFKDKFNSKEKEIRDVLSKRNSSILAHGNQSIKPKVYEAILEIVLELMNLKKEELVKFPEFELTVWMKELI